MIESRLGAKAEAAFIGSVAAGELDVVDLTDADWARCRDLIVQYADLRLGLVDASVIALAERLSITTVGHAKPPGLRSGALDPLRSARSDPLSQAETWQSLLAIRHASVARTR
jgi:hypothetical protein